jgi:hypothetical protein
VEVPVSQLIEQGQDFVGHPSYAVAGAMSEHDRDEMMDPVNAKAIVEAWLDSPVSVEGEPEAPVEPPPTNGEEG